ncbi:MAG: D-tyrosyl-tRNA(Tyr) deacylase [Bacteroidales bacterium]|jgi:D-tyrosyl-tRNA(Tyr) deacylase|nr:D-tyrosyl-tRNA(Tyr) deacylase [Bacteroidales bacterium]
MKAVIQRVLQASVTIEKQIYSSIGNGLLMLVSVEEADNTEDIVWLAQKTVNMRIFNDEQGIMNRSLLDTNGELLIVSNFTLHASVKKGNRPTYIKAAKREISQPMYENFVSYLANIYNIDVKTGIFGADMQVELINDGPVTIIIDTKNRI